MDFKGGIIIIDSLLWDKSPIKEKWRRVSPRDITAKKPVRLKIRYVTKSSAISNIPNLIFSNHPSTRFGCGFIVDFRDKIQNFRALRGYAFALAAAEGLWGSNPAISKPWGTVGLLINPVVDNKNKVNADLIRKLWKQLHHESGAMFQSSAYCIENEITVIDCDGFLQLDWVEEMNEYDFLIALAVAPNVKIAATAQQIAENIKEKQYLRDFEHNISNGIITFQDDEIKQLLGII